MTKGRRGVSFRPLPALAVLGALAGGAVAGCRRNPSAPVADAGLDAGEGAFAAATADGGLAPARCVLGSSGGTLADLTDRRSVLLGDAISTAGGLAIGAVRKVAGEARASVVRVSADGAQVEELLVARGPEVVGDAPPPKPIARGDETWAAFVGRAPHGDAAAPARGRSIYLARVQRADSTAAPPAPIASFPQHADESMAFDAALSEDAKIVALAWDEDVGAQGVIRVALVPLGGPPTADGGAISPPRTLQVEAADADSPRLTARAGGGWWVAWTSRRPEATEAGAGAIEAPGDVKTFAWVTLAALDADGSPIGAPRRMTPLTGHVSSFDLAPRGRDEIDVFALDETEERSDVGGRVLRAQAPWGRAGAGEAATTSVAFASGAGRGGIDLLARGSDAWLVFTDRGDRLLFAPIAGASIGAASVEEALEGGRLLAPTGAAGAGEEGSLDAGAPFLAAFPLADGALFRSVRCGR